MLTATKNAMYDVRLTTTETRSEKRTKALRPTFADL
jgi:hypothetical protein